MIQSWSTDFEIANIWFQNSLEFASLETKEYFDTTFSRICGILDHKKLFEIITLKRFRGIFKKLKKLYL